MRLSDRDLERFEKLALIAINPGPGLCITCRISGLELQALVEEVKEHRGKTNSRFTMDNIEAQQAEAIRLSEMRKIFDDLTQEHQRVLWNAIYTDTPLPEYFRDTPYAVLDSRMGCLYASPLAKQNAEILMRTFWKRGE